MAARDKELKNVYLDEDDHAGRGLASSELYYTPYELHLQRLLKDEIGERLTAE
jgi:hypothetical protein